MLNNMHRYILNFVFSLCLRLLCSIFCKIFGTWQLEHKSFLFQTLQNSDINLELLTNTTTMWTQPLSFRGRLKGNREWKWPPKFKWKFCQSVTLFWRSRMYSFTSETPSHQKILSCQPCPENSANSWRRIHWDSLSKMVALSLCVQLRVRRPGFSTSNEVSFPSFKTQWKIYRLTRKSRR